MSRVGGHFQITRITKHIYDHLKDILTAFHGYVMSLDSITLCQQPLIPGVSLFEMWARFISLITSPTERAGFIILQITNDGFVLFCCLYPINTNILCWLGILHPVHIPLLSDTLIAEMPISHLEFVLPLLGLGYPIPELSFFSLYSVWYPSFAP